MFSYYTTVMHLKLSFCFEMIMYCMALTGPFYNSQGCSDNERIITLLLNNATIQILLLICCQYVFFPMLFIMLCLPHPPLLFTYICTAFAYKQFYLHIFINYFKSKRIIPPPCFFFLFRIWAHLIVFISTLYIIHVWILPQTVWEVYRNYPLRPSVDISRNRNFS